MYQMHDCCLYCPLALVDFAAESTIDPSDIRTFARVSGGIWTQGEVEHLERLGRHPSHYLRDIAGIPAGIVNLGATCFLNVWQ